jgi:OOP family OmpA-OmpF porin
LRKASISSRQRAGFILVLAWLFGCAAPEPAAPAAGVSEATPPPAPHPEVPRPAPTPIAVPKPPPPPEPAEQRIAKPTAAKIESTVLFEYTKSELTPEAKAKLDREILARLGEFATIDYVTVSGHADRIAPQLFNVRLSRARAQTIKAYLVANGADTSKIGVLAFGETLPVKSCHDERDRERLIECLAPNRRAVIVVRGRLK